MHASVLHCTAVQRHPPSCKHASVDLPHPAPGADCWWLAAAAKADITAEASCRLPTMVAQVPGWDCSIDHLPGTAASVPARLLLTLGSATDLLMPSIHCPGCLCEVQGLGRASFASTHLLNRPVLPSGKLCVCVCVIKQQLTSHSGSQVQHVSVCSPNRGGCPVACCTPSHLPLIGQRQLRRVWRSHQ